MSMTDARLLSDAMKLAFEDLGKVSGGESDAGAPLPPACECKPTRDGGLECHDANGRTC